MRLNYTTRFAWTKGDLAYVGASQSSFQTLLPSFVVGEAVAPPFDLAVFDS